MVKIGEKHMIKADGMCFMVCDVLKRPENSKIGTPGEPYYRPFAYTSTFRQALECVFNVLRREVCEGSEIISLDAAISEMRRLEAEEQEILDSRVGEI